MSRTLSGDRKEDTPCHLLLDQSLEQEGCLLRARSLLPTGDCHLQDPRSRGLSLLAGDFSQQRH